MQYHSPSSFNEAVAISNSSSGLVKYLAGGTDVLVQLKIGTKSPDHLIDIKSGEIIEFVDEEIEELQKKVAKKYGYKLVDHKLELYGVKVNSKDE